MNTTRTIYLEHVHGAMLRPVGGDNDAALQSFLTLNAAYFLGEWLPARTHDRLMWRLATSQDGLADLPVPAGDVEATQLAQHVRELAAEFGPTPWTERIAAETEALVPAQAADWDTAVSTAIPTVVRGGDGGPLLLAHARRRLWDLTRVAPVDAPSAPAPEWALRFARDAVAAEYGHAIQVVEALLAELSRALPIVRAPSRRGHEHTTRTASP